MNSAVDLLIAGAGPTGCVFAETAATILGWKVLVVEKRNHVGGNCHDPLHPSGIRIHRYGPHYFRTNSERVIAYLSRFTKWIPANYRVKTLVNGTLYPFPVNLDTMEQFFKRRFTARSARKFLETRRITCRQPRTSEEFVLNRIGHELYESFYLNYTIKQWGRHPRNLGSEVCGRIPVRFNRNDQYADQEFRQMPRDGYTALFDKMLSHPNIEVRLKCDFFDIRKEVHPRYATVYCGPMDSFFGFMQGHLPWRSLKFKFKEENTDFAQPCVQINYPNNYEYTRTVEIKHVTGQKHKHTVISYEFPAGEGEPYYPIPCTESEVIAGEYRSLAEKLERKENIIFAGRLGTYKYLNMDEAVLQALNTFERKIMPLRTLRSGF